MSYNPDPKWAELDLSDIYAKAVCPSCGSQFGNLDSQLERLLELSYYHPRHIPPSITVNCTNPDCQDCDRDWSLPLTAKVYSGEPTCQEEVERQ